jgi:hypothetical protein
MKTTKFYCQLHGITDTRCECAKVSDEYKVTESNTWYNAETDDKAIDVLERVRYEGIRIRIWLGNTKTGKCWNNEHDVLGTVGRSMGPIKVPLLVSSKRSIGGRCILTDCILRIMRTGNQAELYRHPNYKPSSYELRPYVGDCSGITTSVHIDGDNEPEANFVTEKGATNWVAFMRGERMRI